MYLHATACGMKAESLRAYLERWANSHKTFMVDFATTRHAASADARATLAS